MMKLDITIYSTSNCGYCDLMKSFLQDQNLPYKEVHIGNNPDVAQFLMQKTGRLGAPQTSINGEWVLGYDPNTASRIINRFKRFS
ncbi:glutaredoxin family protein [Rummeliibacillus sp. BSL5]